MRVFALGKVASITHWLEDFVVALRHQGHEVEVGATRDPRLSQAIEVLTLSPAIGSPMAALLARRVRRFAPDLIVAIGAFHIPPVVVETIAAIRGRAPFVGWVGDLFEEAAASAGALLDLVAYTDSGLAARHQAFGIRSEAIFLPHAVNPYRTQPNISRRNERMVFVASPTAHRRSVVRSLAAPISLYGRGWTAFPGVDHDVHPRRVKPRALGDLYARHLAAFNVRNEHNVLAGLNQRNFDPYLFDTPVVTDDQGDLERCFAPGEEVLVYRDAEELNDLYGKLRSDRAWAASLGASGRRRVLADHTYARRLETMIHSL